MNLKRARVLSHARSSVVLVGIACLLIHSGAAASDGRSSPATRHEVRDSAGLSAFERYVALGLNQGEKTEIRQFGYELFKRGRSYRLKTEGCGNLHGPASGSIPVLVTGHVNQPGCFELSPSSDLLDGLRVAGGPTKMGSMRDIRLMRRGEVVSRWDLYDLIGYRPHLEPPPLMSGDVIFVPAVGPLVAIVGLVRRPAIYELRGERRLGRVLSLAEGVRQGFGQALQVVVERVEGGRVRKVLERELDRIDSKEEIEITDGDIVKVVNSSARSAEHKGSGTHLSAKRPSHGTPSGILTDMGSLGKDIVMDGLGILGLPLRVRELERVRPARLAIASLAIAAVGGLIPADEPFRQEIRWIDDDAADLLRSIGTGITAAAVGLLYPAGWLAAEPGWRRFALLGAESAGFSFGFARLSKLVFGRSRPDSGRGSKDWFSGGDSFVSSSTALAFSLATTFSEAFDNRWWAVVPSFAAAAAVGIGRMGKDRHWLTDVWGGALLGFGTTRLLLSLHKEREGATPSFMLFPIPSLNLRGLGLVFRF